MEYAKLRGRNISRQHIEVARKFTEYVSADKDVIGVVLLGGAARGFADRGSDIDITVFSQRKNLATLRKGEQKWRGYCVDLSVVRYDFAKEYEWDMVQRWTYSQGKILYDPLGKIASLLKKKIRLSMKERKMLICTEVMFLGWYGIYYKEGEWRGYKFFGKRKPDFWVRRGDILSAHYILNSVIDMILDILFLLNDEFIPDEKWKMFSAFHLKWLPRKFGENIKEATAIKDFTRDDFRRRLSAIRFLYGDIVVKLIDEGLLPRNIYKFLLANRAIYGTV